MWLMPPETWRIKLPPKACDAHVHVFGPVARFPFDAGRSYQRFALELTRLGLKHSFVNQPVEVSAFHSELLKLAGRQDGRVDLVVRFGYGPEMPRSLRRPIEAVMIG